MSAHNSSTSSAKKGGPCHKKHIENLVDLMKEIFDTHAEKQVLQTRGVNPFIKFIKNYEKILDKSKFEDHTPYFIQMFKENRKQFLNILEVDGDNFIAHGNLQVWYGFSVPRFKKQNYRLPISAAYKKAAEMRDAIDDKLTGNAELDAKAISEAEYVMAVELQYYLLLIIKLSLGEKHADYEAISEIVEELSQEAGISRTTSSMGAGFGNVINKVTTAMKAAGIKGPNGEEIDTESIPPPDTIGDMVGKLFDNRKLVDAMGGMFNNLPEKVNVDPNNAGEVMGTIFSGIAPVIKDAMIDITKPPPGVTVTPESQRQAEEMAENFQQGIKSMTEVMSKVDMSSFVSTVESAAGVTGTSSNAGDEEGSDDGSGDE